MSFNPLPRQQPYCSWSDFGVFGKMFLKNKLLQGDGYIKEFEAAFAKIYGVKHALAVHSCRSAFALIVEAMGIRRDDEIILPAFNLPAFPKLLKLKGIKPVFVDIERETLNIDPGLIEANITGKTKAIVVVHLFGNACDMGRIMSIAQKYNLPVIEDCANAFKTKYKDRYVGAYGNAACFSLGDSKDVPTFGGGVLITNDTNLYDRISRIHNEEFTVPRVSEMLKAIIKALIFKLMTLKVMFALFVYPWALLFRLLKFDIIGHFIEEKDKMIKDIKKKKFTNFQAYLGIKKIPEADQRQQIRVNHALWLNRAIAGFGDNFEAPQIIEGGSHAYWNYPLLAVHRFIVLKRLFSHGIDAKRIDIYDCNSMNIFKEFHKDCPVAQKVSTMLLALPIYHYLKEYDVRFMIKSLKRTTGRS